jgi:hypothetical protein
MTPRPRPVSDIESLHANITDALAELRGAREIHAHSPDAESAERRRERAATGKACGGVG